jgi:hypothetical protein
MLRRARGSGRDGDPREGFVTVRVPKEHVAMQARAPDKARAA